ncbi:MCE family protein [Nocardia sp. ET3-3]|uniref:MCE family protein n=1 Tax=Nocardia terrae TaxID=2675851 RepID=A0A7K1V2I1_9NOCA|nr:MlaD family protein [Nocardia terrae]MVU80727.1 MCE family protein [Nocardia terrae]
MIKNRKLVISTAVVAGVVAAAGVGFAMVTGDTTTSSSGYCAIMPDAVGLYEGNPVTQMGLQIGRVDHIRSKGDHVEVSFSLDAGRHYPAGVKAVTRSKSLLADRSLELVGNYQTGPQLKSGQCIALDHSFTPKSISEIAGSAADFIDAMAPDNGKDSFQNAVAGFDAALHGNGELARAMMQHAASASANPDQLISDIGSSILNMAPLTDEALQRWSSLRSILDQMPQVVDAGNKLWPGVLNVTNGTGWLVATLYDIQRSYGDVLWPLLKGGVADVIHLAATRSKDIAALLESIPPVAAMLRQQADNNGGLAITYAPPTVNVGGAEIPAAGLLGLTLAKGQ